MITFSIKLVNTVIQINALNELTKKYCRDFLTDEEPDYVITMTQEDLDNEKDYNPEGHVYVNPEISATYRKIADLLIENNIVVFHSSAVMIDGYAFLFTARSGTGKSTHTDLLNQLLGDRFAYINDDKPLLSVNDDIIVYSSPWNGKERRGNNISSPLKAIIFLNRGIDNTYRYIDDKNEIYIKLLSQIYLPLDKSKREKALQLADKVLRKINFYEINVNKDIDAARMTYERIIKNEIK